MNENMSEEDYLKRHLGDIDESKKQIEKQNFHSDIPHVSVDNVKTSELEYFNFDVRELPCGDFYPVGTLFMVRPARVKEIQAYSMVDDNNFPDIVEKMNNMLAACVRIKYPDGRISSYLDVKDQDRLYLIFVIRELTFQQGSSLSVNAVCSCGADNVIELKRGNFIYHEIDEKLSKFYNKSTGSYHFTTINGKKFELCPPNIGIQKAFGDYIARENADKKEINLSFLKIIPPLLVGRNSITYEGIKAKLNEFTQMDDVSFQFLNAAVGKMTYGIKKLKKVCSCGEEIHTDMQFPSGASGIFVIQDAFETFIKE